MAFALVISGLLSGVLAGLLGIGGGVVLVPILLGLGYAPIEAVASSSLAIVVTSLSGSLQNWRMGYLDTQRVLLLGLPAIATAQLGVLIANWLPSRGLLLAFGLLLLLNTYLVGIRRRLAKKTDPETGVETPRRRLWTPTTARLTTGASAGLLGGLFGIGGGVIMVPMQMLLLHEPIKRAIQTSLGVVVIIAIASTVGHALRGNVVWQAGLILGVGGLISAQLSTRALPKLPERVVSLLFRSLMLGLAIYVFWKAWAQ